MKKFLIVLAMVVTVSLLMGAGCLVNTPPVITTLALPDATVGTAYTATVEATDADGDALTFSVSGPTGMVISEAGVISGWTPTESGTENVIVAVTDGTDLVSANLIITVSAVEPEPNQAPVITSAAITSGKVGLTYTCDVDATDPDGDDLTYSLTEKPLGMAIVAATGVISWDPTDAGVFPVGVKVSDPDGLFDVQGFSITVAEADEPGPEPELVLVGIEVDPDTMDLYVGESDTIDSVTATYEVRGFDVDVDLEDCLFLSGNSEVATVDEFGEVTAVEVGTTNILVSYNDKFDTLEVTVTEPIPMEIIADDLITFTVNALGGFTASLVANSDAGKMVLAYLTLPLLTEFWYYEVEVDAWPGGPGWYQLPVGAVFGDVVFGPQPDGFLLEDITIDFRAKFTTVGTYQIPVEIWEVTTGPIKVERLSSKVITVVVEN